MTPIESGYVVGLVESSTLNVKTFVHSITVRNYGVYRKSSVELSEKLPHLMNKFSAEEFLRQCTEIEESAINPRKFAVVEVSFNYVERNKKTKE